jgi:hypothetical protein
MGYKNFVAGEEALAADINNYLMSQTVSRHASASARSAAITAPTKGQVSILDTDVFQLEVYTGTAWTPMGGFYVRYLHQLGYGDFGPNVSANASLPTVQFPRVASFMYDLEIYITVKTGQSGAQAANFQIITGSSGGAPALQPISVFSLSPFLAISIPLKGLYRNVPANTLVAPYMNIAVGSGTPAITVSAVSGSVTAFPPGSEF